MVSGPDGRNELGHIRMSFQAPEPLGRFEDTSGEPAQHHLAASPALHVTFDVAVPADEALGGIRGGQRVLDPGGEAERTTSLATGPGRGRDRLALIEDQSYRPRLVVIREAPPPPPALRVRHGRHRIPLSEDVHQPGSSPDHHFGPCVSCPISPVMGKDWPAWTWPHGC